MTRKNNNNFEINRTKSSVACMLAITILLLGATSVAQANDGDFEQSNPVEDAWTPAIQPNIYSEIESESGGTFSEEEILQFLDDVMNNGDSGYSELDGVTDSLGNVLMLHSYDDGVFISTYKEDNQSIALKWEIPLTDCELESMSMETNEHGVFLAMNCYDYAGDEIQIFQITFASGPVLLTTYSAQPSAHFNNVEIVTIDGSLGVFWDEEYFSGSRLMATSAPLPSLTQWDTPVELLSDTYEFHGQIEVFPVEDSAYR